MSGSASSRLLCAAQGACENRGEWLILYVTDPRIPPSSSVRIPVSKKKAAGSAPAAFSNLAPQVGLEPTTLRLTAECSAIELLRNKRPCIVSNYARAQRNFYNRWKLERQGDLFWSADAVSKRVVESSTFGLCWLPSHSLELNSDDWRQTALPQKSVPEFVSVQPLCSLCLGGGIFRRIFTTEAQRTQRVHRENKRVALLGQSRVIPHLLPINRKWRV
jgi:hypothetical protein